VVLSLRRHLDREAIAHSNADSNTHARHVSRRKVDKQISWIAEPADQAGAEVFAFKPESVGLGQGKYYQGHGAEEREVTGPGFESHLASTNWQRRWNHAEMKRGDKIALTKRIRSQDACEEFVVNLSPWQNHCLVTTLKQLDESGVPRKKQKELVEVIAGDIRGEVVREFSRISGRDVIGSYIHFDSSKIHVGVIHSRVGKDNHLIGEKYLRTIGPWSVAQSRIARLGLVDKSDTRLQENLQRFATRHGKDRKPLDLHLHEVADEQFAKAIKALGAQAEARFEASKDFYKDWKKNQRQTAILQSPAIQRVAWQVLRIVTPLLPPPVRTALAVTRTAGQALSVISVALEQLAPQGELPKEADKNNYANRSHPTISR
jgi:hypothetical protein